MQVRRLTPVECERLQGFPDNFTLVPHGTNHAKDFREWLGYLRLRIAGLTEAEARRLAADGPRYKALGNSMAVPVMRWIGERIQLVDWLYADIFSPITDKPAQPFPASAYPPNVKPVHAPDGPLHSPIGGSV